MDEILSTSINHVVANIDYYSCLDPINEYEVKGFASMCEGGKYIVTDRSTGACITFDIEEKDVYLHRITDGMIQELLIADDNLLRSASLLVVLMGHGIEAFFEEAPAIKLEYSDFDPYIREKEEFGVSD